MYVVIRSKKSPSILVEVLTWLVSHRFNGNVIAFICHSVMYFLYPSNKQKIESMIDNVRIAGWDVCVYIICSAIETRRKRARRWSVRN